MKTIDLSQFMLLKPEQMIVGSFDKVGMFSIKTANQTLSDAALKPNPIPLWKKIWHLGEVACLFSDSNLGKSILAVQIATEIAKSLSVLLFDFELSEKQFQMRYTGDFGEYYKFPNNLYRVEINNEYLNLDDINLNIIDNIEQAAIQTEAKVLIIDNLTYMCLDSENGKDAGELMLRLMVLKKKYDLSILVLAHTPKRQMHNPITQNDLAGSKKLFNFFDAVFAIGLSAKDNNLRYIKQIKARICEYTHDASNVIVAKIVKVGCFLSFEEQYCDSEKEHLKEKPIINDPELINTVKEMHQEGKSYREIASELGINKNKIGGILNQ